MSISVDDGTLFLALEDYLKRDDIEEDDKKNDGLRVLLSRDLLHVTYLLCGNTPFAYPSTVVSDDRWNDIRNGISLDTIDGFGITVSFLAKYEMMIKWEEVTRGRQNGVQV